MTRLDGSVALVTGAGSGIGRALAVALAGEGAAVWLCGRDPAKLEETAALLPGGRATVARADLTADAEADALAGRLRAGAGRLDLLVHSAGAFHLGPWAGVPAEELDALYRTNVRAPYRLTRALLPLLQAARGQVVFVNSSAAVNAAPNWGAYSATKSALRSLADSLRAEVNRDGVRVLSVFPGRTASPMQAAIFAAEGRPYAPEKLLQPADVAASVLQALTLPRTAELTELHIRPMQKG
jgi:NAD(P)-dependent dehydrogenase (short-subunit alcohol dehydrogenase family)